MNCENSRYRISTLPRFFRAARSPFSSRDIIQAITSATPTGLQTRAPLFIPNSLHRVLPSSRHPRWIERKMGNHRGCISRREPPQMEERPLVRFQFRISNRISAARICEHISSWWIPREIERSERDQEKRAPRGAPNDDGDKSRGTATAIKQSMPWFGRDTTTARSFKTHGGNV